MFKYIKFNQLPKNLLIFVPFIVANQKIKIEIFADLLVAFIIFSIITTLVYIINDYTDNHIDQNNKVKKKILPKINFKSFIIANVCLFFSLIFSFFSNYFSLILVLYILVFYLYNYFLKKIKYLDILCLVTFYISRLFYGSEISDIYLTNFFLLFFVILFLSLSIHKRLIQIKVNKLKEKNKIVPYFLNDISFLNFLLITFTCFSVIIFAIYLFNIYGFINIRGIILIIYCIISFRLLILNLKNKINLDIYAFVFKDKKILALALIAILLILIEFFL